MGCPLPPAASMAPSLTCQCVTSWNSSLIPSFAREAYLSSHTWQLPSLRPIGDLPVIKLALRPYWHL